MTDTSNVTPDLTPQEWKQVRRAPHLAALVMCLAHPTSISIAREAMAMPGILRKLLEEHADNPFVCATLQGAGDAPRVTNWDPNATEAQAKEMLLELRKVAELVDRKTPATDYRTNNEARVFKEVLLRIAIDVAGVSGEGFLGTGPRVSDREKQMLDRLRQVLGLK